MLAVVLTGVAASGCGGSPSHHEASAQSAAKAPPREDTGTVYAQDAYLQSGSSAELLKVPSAQIDVRCGHRRRSIVTVTGRGQTTSAVVSSTGVGVLQPKLQPGTALGVPLRNPGIQTWTLAPISEGDAQPTVLTIGISELKPSDPYDCAVLAQATVGASVGTITR